MPVDLSELKKVSSGLYEDGTPYRSEIVDDAIAEIEALRAASVGVNVGVGDVRARLYQSLCDYRLHNAVDEDGAQYPLVDLVTPDGRSIAEGEEELFQLADHLLDAVGANVGVALKPCPEEPEHLCCYPNCTCAPQREPDAKMENARPLAEWHEDDGFVTWWVLPVCEPAWIGSPNCSDWPGYHTHWTPHPPLPQPPSEVG